MSVSFEEQATMVLIQGQQLHAQGAYQEALERFEAVVEAFRELGNRRLEAMALHFMGACCRMLDRHQDALRYLEAALPIHREVGDREGEGATLGNLAYVHEYLGDLETAIDEYGQALPIKVELGNQTEEANLVSRRGVLLRRLGRHQEALADHQRSLELYTAVEHVAGTGRALNNLGSASQDLGRLDDALRYYERAIPILRDVGERNSEADALNNLGLLHSDEGQHAEAVEQLTQAVAMRRELGDLDGADNAQRHLDMATRRLEFQESFREQEERLARARETDDRRGEGLALNNLGVLCHELGRHEDAWEYFDQAVAALRDADAPEHLRDTLRSAAEASISVGRGGEAVSYLEEALPVVERLANQDDLSDVLHQLGAVCQMLGRSEEALEYYSRALPVLRQVGDTEGVAATLSNLGRMYHSFGQFERGLEQHEQALAIAVEHGHQKGEATTRENLGWAYSRLERPWDALEHYERALELHREVRNQEGELGTVTGLGWLCHALGRSEEASEHLGRALSLARELGNRAAEIMPLLGLGLFHQHEPEAAERFFDAALDLAGEFNWGGPQVTALTSLALIQERHGREQDALDGFARATEIADRMRTEVLSDQLRTSYFATLSELYNAYIARLVERGENELALQVAERGRARGFIDLLTEAGAQVQDGAPQELAGRERELLGILASKRDERLREGTKAPEERDDAVVADLDREIHDLELELDALELRIQSEAPAYASVTQPGFAWDLPRIQEELLDERTALLEYVLCSPETLGSPEMLARPKSFLFCVLENDLKVFPLPPREEIEEKVRELRVAVLHGLQAYPHGHALYDALIAPAADMIEGKDLLICADGALHYLPFSLLLTEEPRSDGPPADGGIDPGPQRSAVAGTEPELLDEVERALAGVPAFDYATLPYLVRGHALSYAASATVAGLVHADAEGGERTYDGDLAGFADPSDLAGAEENAGELGAALAHTRDRLEPLPKTADEVWTLAELVATGTLPADRPESYDDERISVRTASAATKEEIAALTSGERGYRFFHIASHGLLDAEKPQYSGLVLSPGTGGDPFWRTFEIVNARITSELVVLSACETGLGKIVSGEGIVGLTRAFLYAGAPSVCVSLWKVADESSPPLMRSFYEAILAGESKGRALQAAQRGMLDEGLYAHPYWWAPFVVVGSR